MGCVGCSVQTLIFCVVCKGKAYYKVCRGMWGVHTLVLCGCVGYKGVWDVYSLVCRGVCHVVLSVCREVCGMYTVGV